MSVNAISVIIKGACLLTPSYPQNKTLPGEMGFNVVLGGYFSTKRAAASVELGLWVPPGQVMNLCYSILRVSFLYFVCLFVYFHLFIYRFIHLFICSFKLFIHLFIY